MIPVGQVEVHHVEHALRALRGVARARRPELWSLVLSREDAGDVRSDRLARDSPRRTRRCRAICAIYNEGIEGRQATFETRPRARTTCWTGSRTSCRSSLPSTAIGSGRSWVGPRLPYSDRCVYEGIGEHAVYVSGGARGRGIGRHLLEALAVAAEERGLYKLTSRVFTTNAPSLAAHRAAGFSEVGIQQRHGRLDGDWKDCVLVERLLGPASAPPTASS